MTETPLEVQSTAATVRHNIRQHFSPCTWILSISVRHACPAPWGQWITWMRLNTTRWLHLESCLDSSLPMQLQHCTVCRLVRPFGPDGNISTTFGWPCLEIWYRYPGSSGDEPHWTFNDPLTFQVAPWWGWHLQFWAQCLDNYVAMKLWRHLFFGTG